MNRYALLGSVNAKGKLQAADGGLLSVANGPLGADVSVSWDFPAIENTGLSISGHRVDLTVLALDSTSTMPLKRSWTLRPTVSSLNLSPYYSKTTPVALVVTYRLQVNDLPDEAPETVVIFIADVPQESQPSVAPAK